MKKVTLGLLITFVAVAMVASPKPTPTPGEKRYGGVQYAGRADSICCQDWNNNGKCVKWGPTSGGCPSAPRLRAPTPTPNGSKTISDGKGKMPPATGKEVAPVEPTPGETRNQPAGGIVLPTNKVEGGKNDGEKNVTPSASEKTTIKTTHSNTYKEVASTPTPAVDKPIVYGTPKIKDTKSNGSLRSGEVVGGDLPTRNVTPSESDKTTTINTTKSNSYKEVAPTTPTPGPAESSNLNSSRSNTFREGAPVTATPTSGPVEATTVKGSRSNGSERNSGHASESKPKPTPTKVRAGLK